MFAAIISFLLKPRSCACACGVVDRILKQGYMTHNLGRPRGDSFSHGALPSGKNSVCKFSFASFAFLQLRAFQIFAHDWIKFTPLAIQFLFDRRDYVLRNRLQDVMKISDTSGN